MIGIDLVKLSRISHFLDRFGEKALNRFLNQDEIKLIKNQRTAAGFWAIKEACSKALGVGIGSECQFHDIIISKTDKGAPIIALSHTISKKFNIIDTSVSVTHDGEYAIAVVVLESTTTNKI